MADDILSKEGAETPSIDTFSFHDSTEPEDDDLFYFTRIEEKRGKTGFHADLKSFDTSVSFDNQKFVGFPDIRLRTQVTAALSAILERHKHRVRLSGSAGDDVNGQGLDPRIQMADLLLRLRFIELAKQLTTWSLLIRKRPWIHLFFQTLRELMPVQVRARFTDHAKVDAWINRAFATKFSISAHQMGAVKESSFVRPSTRNSLETFISVSRQMSCTAPSITEIWYPYLDQNLVEFLKSVPLDQLLRPGQRRSLMRRALKDLLPPEVLTRKTKAAPGRCFSVALDKYWNEVELIFSSPFISRLGYVERDRIHEALVAVKNGNLPEYISRFLKTFSLELWLRDAESCGVISTPPPRALNADRSLAGTGTRFKNRLEPKPESIALTTLASGVANSEKERR